MSLNPPNVRYPFNLPADTDPEVKKAIEWTFNGLLIHEQAFAAIGKPTSATSTTTIIQSGGSGGGGGSSQVVGGVNDQLGVPSYTTQQSDYGVKIIVGDSSAVTVNLNGGVTTPWFCIIDNDSSSVASLTPSSPTTLIGEQEIDPGCFGIVYFDGANFWSGATKIATDSSLGYVRPDAVSIAISGGIISTIGIDSTIATAPLTPGGTQGSMTFLNGLLISSVQAT